jgi:hypothetical protein
MNCHTLSRRELLLTLGCAAHAKSALSPASFPWAVDRTAHFARREAHGEVRDPTPAETRSGGEALHSRGARGRRPEGFFFLGGESVGIFFSRLTTRRGLGMGE